MFIKTTHHSGGGISGTETRNGLSVGSDDQKKEFFKKRAYGKFNATIFKMITDKLNEDIEIKKEWILDSLNEISKLHRWLDVDDGPNIVYPSTMYLIKYLLNRSTQIGFEVVGDILGGEEIEIDKTDYRVILDGPSRSSIIISLQVLSVICHQTTK